MKDFDYLLVFDADHELHAAREVSRHSAAAGDGDALSHNTLVAVCDEHPCSHDLRMRDSRDPDDPSSRGEHREDHVSEDNSPHDQCGGKVQKRCGPHSTGVEEFASTTSIPTVAYLNRHRTGVVRLLFLCVGIVGGWRSQEMTLWALGEVLMEFSVVLDPPH